MQHKFEGYTKVRWVRHNRQFQRVWSERDSVYGCNAQLGDIMTICTQYVHSELGNYYCVYIGNPHDEVHHHIHESMLGYVSDPVQGEGPQDVMYRVSYQKSSWQAGVSHAVYNEGMLPAIAHALCGEMPPDLTGNRNRFGSTDGQFVALCIGET